MKNKKVKLIDLPSLKPNYGVSFFTTPSGNKKIIRKQLKKLWHLFF